MSLQIVEHGLQLFSSGDGGGIGGVGADADFAERRVVHVEQFAVAR